MQRVEHAARQRFAVIVIAGFSGLSGKNKGLLKFSITFPRFENIIESMLTHSERLSSARKVIENLLRARKAIRIYPDSNPVTGKVIDDLYSELLKLLAIQDRLSFDITRDAIHFELEEIFHSASQENNVPLFLFRDGVREVTFKKGLTRDEVSGFVRVVSGDWEHEGIGDDVVTKIWDQDFRHIRCIVYEPDMFAWEEARGTSDAGASAEKNLTTELLKAHKDALLKKAETEAFTEVIEFSDGELIALRREIEINPVDKTGKLLAIILELFLLAETEEEYREIENIMKKAVERALDGKKIDVLADFFINVKKAYMDAELDPRFKANLSRIFSFFSSEKFLTKVGAMLDGGFRLSDETFSKLILLLDRRSIPVLIMILGYLDTISARKTIVNILGKIGMTDVQAVTRGLSDERWYVVRNIVIALRKIGDKASKQNLLNIMSHKDARVRREVIKSLAEIGGGELIGLLKQALDDPDLSIRQTALNALSHLEEPLARTLLIDLVQNNTFPARDYDEKRDYYQALLKYDGEDVRRLLEKGLRKRSFLGKRKNDESKAAIAYNIGLLGDKDFLGDLYELADSKTEILRQTVAEAIRKIEHGA